jgi:hypothetical protein
MGPAKNSLSTSSHQRVKNSPFTNVFLPSPIDPAKTSSYQCLSIAAHSVPSKFSPFTNPNVLPNPQILTLYQCLKQVPQSSRRR